MASTIVERRNQVGIAHVYTSTTRAVGSPYKTAEDHVKSYDVFGFRD